MNRASENPHPSSPWPRRFVLAAAVVLVPLFLFGGTVTTIGAGMAVEGWWNAEGHFMPFFPIEKWFRDLATFVEHSHRQFGLVLGILMLAACLATWLTDRRRSARVLVVVTTLAVAFQGWLGGSRVLEDSPRFAFLHGAFAQLVFALMAATLVHLSRGWRRRLGRAPDGLRRAALVATGVVFAQALLGAWYRHGLRNDLGSDVEQRLGLHALFALLALGAVAWLAVRARTVAPVDELDHPLRRLARRLTALLWLQIALGLLSMVAYRPESTGFIEWALATAHVFCGALLFAHCVLASVLSWGREVTAEQGSGAHGRTSLEAAR